jgi:hypothetical protein
MIGDWATSKRLAGKKSATFQKNVHKSELLQEFELGDG